MPSTECLQNIASCSQTSISVGVCRHTAAVCVCVCNSNGRSLACVAICRVAYRRANRARPAHAHTLRWWEVSAYGSRVSCTWAGVPRGGIEGIIVMLRKGYHRKNI